MCRRDRRRTDLTPPDNPATKIFSHSFHFKEREAEKIGFILIESETAIPFVHIVTCVRIRVTLGIRLPYSCRNIQKYTIGEKKNQWTNRERARGYTLQYKDTPVQLREYMTGLQIIGV